MLHPDRRGFGAKVRGSFPGIKHSADTDTEAEVRQDGISRLGADAFYHRFVKVIELFKGTIRHADDGISEFDAYPCIELEYPMVAPEFIDIDHQVDDMIILFFGEGQGSAVIRGVRLLGIGFTVIIMLRMYVPIMHIFDTKGIPVILVLSTKSFYPQSGYITLFKINPSRAINGPVPVPGKFYPKAGARTIKAIQQGKRFVID